MDTFRTLFPRFLNTNVDPKTRIVMFAGALLLGTSSAVAAAWSTLPASSSSSQPTSATRTWRSPSLLVPWSVTPRFTSCEAVDEASSPRKTQGLQVLEEFGLTHHRSTSWKEVPSPQRASAMAENHAIFGTLMSQPGLVQEYRVFSPATTRTSSSSSTSTTTDDDTEPLLLVMAAVHLGPKLNGHDGIVHGGILALLMDDILGFAYEAMPVNAPKMAVTANLNINFRHPLSPDTRFIIQAFLKEREGRKLYFEVRVTSPDETVVYCEGTSLFVVPRAFAD